MTPVIEVKLLHGAKAPEYHTTGAAAIDLCAVGEFEQAVLRPGESHSFNTGVAVNINDPKIVALLDGRSGLGFSKGVRLSNCVGVIDSDFQGEIMARLHNDGKEPYTIYHGDRIAQLLFVPVIRPNFAFVEQFTTETARGINGFGSTGR